ncbi:MAG: ferric reductase-like transmembrane domain-containing protein [Candidatus Lokiarchaeota archaeon]|nr:ferric reductase-like transmembrane domain-containing protein [Candidatus Lokiarchaeota archaeon]
MSTKRNRILLIIGNILVIILLIIKILPSENIFDGIIRFAALYGFICLFIATILTLYLPKIYKIFGKTFIKIHHIYSILGLILVTIHPIAFAIEQLDITVFIPIFYPWIDFWKLAGRPALILIYLAIVAVILRKKISKIWRYLHSLNYIAILFAYIHGALIGTDFQDPFIFITFTIFSSLVILTLLYKRYLKIKMKKK